MRLVIGCTRCHCCRETTQVAHTYDGTSLTTHEPRGGAKHFRNVTLRRCVYSGVDSPDVITRFLHGLLHIRLYRI